MHGIVFTLHLFHHDFEFLKVAAVSLQPIDLILLLLNLILKSIYFVFLTWLIIFSNSFCFFNLVLYMFLKSINFFFSNSGFSLCIYWLKMTLILNVIKLAANIVIVILHILNLCFQVVDCSCYVLFLISILDLLLSDFFSDNIKHLMFIHCPFFYFFEVIYIHSQSKQFLIFNSLRFLNFL